MKHFVTALILGATLSSLAWAAPQTVVLSVPGMNCASCPLTVKTALKKVAGVSDIDVAYKQKEVTVTFDDTKTKIEALTQATTEAGYRVNDNLMGFF